MPMATISASVPIRLALRLKKIAEEEHRSVSSLVAQAIESFLDTREGSTMQNTKDGGHGGQRDL